MPKTHAHPTREQLGAYSAGQLAPVAAAAVEAHVRQCDPCCETMLGIASDDTFVALLREARVSSGDEITSGQETGKHAPQSSEVPRQLMEHRRYKAVELVGKGGMGDVYRAEHRMMERTVAIKVIHRELVRNPDAVDRFHREVKTAARLSHPNIVTAFDAEQADDLHFLVMEYVDGVNLAQLVEQRGPLSIETACSYVNQAAVAMQYAHERGMVHRDIKPHNLMVDEAGHVKILDFGLASLARQAVPMGNTFVPSGDLTSAGSIMGTPSYISPEQADDARRADIRSDLYSLGATLYYLLAGHAPFAGGDVSHTLQSHADVEPRPIEELREDVPAPVAGTLRRMMAKNPDQRYQTPREVAAALEPFAEDSHANPHPAVQTASGDRRLFAQPAVVAAVALLMVAILGVAWYAATRDEAGPVGDAGAVDQNAAPVVDTCEGSGSGEADDAAPGKIAAIAAINELGGRMRFNGSPEVVTVTLQGRHIRDSHLAILKGVPNLTTLYLPDTNISDAGLKRYISGMTQLRNLYLFDTKVTDEGLEQLEKLTNLSVLYLNGTKITDAGLKHIKGLGKMRSLSLDATAVTDAGLDKHIQEMTDLSMLFLKNSAISDAGLEHLKALKNLLHLDVRNTKVTDAGVDKLHQALPNCKIVH